MPDGSSPTPRSPTAPDRNRRWVAIITVAILAPFLNKAFHIDDPLFVYTAQQILSDPLDPYGFEVNWYGFSMPMHRVMQNPPLTAYFIALVTLFTGLNEIALHAAFLLPAVAAVLGTYRLAVNMGGRPMVAALIVALSPGFVVSSTNVMSDTMLLAFWTWSVVLWRQGIVHENRRSLVIAACLAGLAAMTKYYGVCLLPLLLADALLRQKRWTAQVAWLLAPAAMFGGYMAWASATYGHVPLIGAAQYSIDARLAQLDEWPWVGLIALSFTGGCLLPALFLTPMWLSRRLLLVAGLVAAALFLISGSDHAVLSAHVGLFGAIGAAVVVLALAALKRPLDPDRVMLALWILGTLIFAAVLNWTVSARTLLPLVPPVAVLISLRLQHSRGYALQPTNVRLISALVLSAVIALMVCFADYKHANAFRAAAAQLAVAPEHVQRNIAYQGAWGFKYYMNQHGFTAVDYAQPARAGQHIAIPMQNTNVVLPAKQFVARAGGMAMPAFAYAATHDDRLGAGFYSHRTYGPVPFVLGRSLPFDVRVFELSQPMMWAAPHELERMRRQADPR